MLVKTLTLTTDFGLRDPYVAEMKASILGTCPIATIVDITHEVEKFNIRMGSYILASAAPYFPKGTIHIAVVDPGVGTQRRPLLIQTKRGFLIGPDNGLLYLASQKEGILETRQITNPKLMLPRVSNTFHGRDIFAPTAAHLANGVSPTEFGPTVHDLVKPSFAKVTRRGSTLAGEILHIDSFGNIITNITEREIVLLHPIENCSIQLNDHELQLDMGKTYGDHELHQFLALIGSQGYLEIAVNQGNAAKKLGAKAGDKISLTKA